MHQEELGEVALAAGSNVDGIESRLGKHVLAAL